MNPIKYQFSTIKFINLIYYYKFTSRFVRVLSLGEKGIEIIPSKESQKMNLINCNIHSAE